MIPACMVDVLIGTEKLYECKSYTSATTLDCLTCIKRVEPVAVTQGEEAG